MEVFILDYSMLSEIKIMTSLGKGWLVASEELVMLHFLICVLATSVHFVKITSQPYTYDICDFSVHSVYFN